jgi:hypothetical protein
VSRSSERGPSPMKGLFFVDHPSTSPLPDGDGAITGPLSWK